MLMQPVRVFLLDKRQNVPAISRRLALSGCRAVLVLRESDHDPAYVGCSDPDDQVLEIADPELDWSGLVQFAKQRELQFSVLCDDGFRGIRLDYCPGASLPTDHLHAAAAVRAGAEY
jgi:hypothetical protein